MNNHYRKYILGIVLLSPMVTFAATFKDFVDSVLNIGGLLMPLLFSIALAWFIYGIITFIKSADNPEQRKKGKQRILWGILALTAMVGYLGFTSVFTQSFFGENATVVPQLFE